MSLRLIPYVAPKLKGAQKRKTAVFRVKLHFTLCEYCQRQKMVRGERPLLRENVTEIDHLPL